jgi:hypothetical protein
VLCGGGRPPLCVFTFWGCLNESSQTHPKNSLLADPQIQVEGQEDDKAVEVPTTLPASSVVGVALHG